jgi:hypothetical protein
MRIPAIEGEETRGRILLKRLRIKPRRLVDQPLPGEVRIHGRRPRPPLHPIPPPMAATSFYRRHIACSVQLAPVSVPGQGFAPMTGECGSVVAVYFNVLSICCNSAMCPSVFKGAVQKNRLSE